MQETDVNGQGSMSFQERVTYARDQRDISHENASTAARCGSGLGDEFTRLGIQIAAVLFVFAGFFLGSFSGESLSGFPHAGIESLRLAFACVLVFLIASVCLGLLHIKQKQKFWHVLRIQRIARFQQWDRVVRKSASFDEGEAFQQGIAGVSEAFASSSAWVGILQTVCLGIATALLLVLMLVFLFR